MLVTITDDDRAIVEPNPHRERKGDLTPEQLAWCKRYVPGFRAAKRDADRAIRHAERVNGKVRRA